MLLLKCHIPKLLNVHQWGKFANMYKTYGTHWHQSCDEECCTQKIMMPILTMIMMHPECIS